MLQGFDFSEAAGGGIVLVRLGAVHYNPRICLWQREYAWVRTKSSRR